MDRTPDEAVKFYLRAAEGATTRARAVLHRGALKAATAGKGEQG